MAVTLHSLYFFDEFTGLGGGGIEFLSGCIGDKITAEMTVDIKWSAENIPLTFTADGKTIERMDIVTYTIPTTPFTTGFYASFITDGFKVGDTIEIVGSDNNDGTYTITAVTDKIITVAEALVSETMDITSIYGTTAIIAIDFYYNLIENSLDENYKSLFDTNNSNRFNCPTCSSPMASTQMTPVGKSKAWVNGTAHIDDVTYPTAPAYTQRFKITHTFFITPLFIAAWKSNIDNGTNPKGFYNDTETLKYVAKVEAKYVNLEATPAHTGDLSIDMNEGNVGFFNEFVNGFDANYTLKSIYYTDKTSGESVDALQYDKDTDVEIRLTSVNSKFVAGCKVVLNQLYCSIDSRDYADTTTNMISNYRFDRVLLTEGAAAADGERVGTDEQCITDAEATLISADELKITYTCDLSNAYSAFIEAKDAFNRNFLIFCTPQDLAVTTTNTFDRNAVKCGWGVYFADLINVGLFEITNSEISIKYGALYNWYAATDVRDITSGGGWIVPADTDFATLVSYLIANGFNYDDTLIDNKIAKSLTEKGIWLSSAIVGAVGNSDFPLKRNITGFEAKGSGYRNGVGLYINIQINEIYWTKTESLADPNEAYMYGFNYTAVNFTSTDFNKLEGLSLRLVRPATAPELLLADGTLCTPYIGNNSQSYNTVKIGTQVWTAENLVETKYQNGDAIPLVTDNAAWAALTDGAYCWYDNTKMNGFDFYIGNIITPNIGFKEAASDYYYTDFKAFSNDTILAKCLFQVKTKSDARLNNLTVRIEATKIYETSIVLEEHSFNLTAFPLDADLIQQIDIEEATRLKLPTGSEYESYIVRRYPSADNGDYVVYKLVYPFKVRYEHWVKFISEAYPYGTQDWAVYEADGWAIKFRLYADVLDNNTNYTTDFMHEADLTVTGFDVEQTPALNCEIKTYDASGTNETDGLVLSDSNTLIEATFTGDFAALPTGFTGYYGILTIDNNEVGGAFYNQYADTEDEPIEGSIWYTGATLTVVNATTITVSAVIDYTKLKDLSAGRFPLNYLSFYARLGYKR